MKGREVAGERLDPRVLSVDCSVTATSESSRPMCLWSPSNRGSKFPPTQSPEELSRSDGGPSRVSCPVRSGTNYPVTERGVPHQSCGLRPGGFPTSQLHGPSSHSGLDHRLPLSLTRDSGGGDVPVVFSQREQNFVTQQTALSATTEICSFARATPSRVVATPTQFNEFVVGQTQLPLLGGVGVASQGPAHPRKGGPAGGTGGADVREREVTLDRLRAGGAGPLHQGGGMVWGQGEE